MPKLNTITANAEPSKGFFISMLTRDIRLTDCILDLIDNSIDSVVFNTNFDPMEDLLKKKQSKKQGLGAYSVEITFDEKHFEIKDNAFGISKDDAEERVFRFGADAIRKGKKGGLSIYGIGMKRACYKIGNVIAIQSNTNKTHLEVGYNVSSWLKEDDWQLDIKWRNKILKDARGTTIVVKDLHPEIIDNFKLAMFKADLLEKIGSVYSLFIEKGLVIKVNGIKAESHVPTLPESKEVQSSRKSFEKDGVKTLILAGINSSEEKGAGGWYIFCNGRMVLEADKTSNTGWGSDLRKFHQAINPFLGFVYFQSDKLDSLPWTTTKDNVNFESPIYQYTLSRMKAIAAPIVKMLGRRYNEKGFAEEYKKVVQSTKELELTDISKRDKKFLFKVSKQGKTEEVTFIAPTSDLKRAKNTIGKPNMSNGDVGEYTFKYFLDREVQ